ncbi:MAG: hypothetical protein RLZZ546_887 [Bacteroidota bacterium]
MTKKLKILFMGSPEFAVTALNALVESEHEVVGVVTATDKLGGRGGNQIIESEVKKYSLLKNLNILQPKNLKNPNFIKEITKLNADIFIVVAFRMLPEIVWNIPRLGTFNIHGSLLPAYRGAAPINWAIIQGENQTGVTMFKLQHDIDTGSILSQSIIDIFEDDDFGSVYERLKKVGAELLMSSLNDISNEHYTLIPQDDTKASHAPKIFHETCLIDFNKKTEEVKNFVRGLSPYPAAHFKFYDQEMKVYKVSSIIEAHHMSPGTIVMEGKKKLKVACKDGYVDILDLKLEGKKRMNPSDFLNGYKTKE